MLSVTPKNLFTVLLLAAHASFGTASESTTIMLSPNDPCGWLGSVQNFYQLPSKVQDAIRVVSQEILGLYGTRRNFEPPLHVKDDDENEYFIKVLFQDRSQSAAKIKQRENKLKVFEVELVFGGDLKKIPQFEAALSSLTRTTPIGDREVKLLQEILHLRTRLRNFVARLEKVGIEISQDFRLNHIYAETEYLLERDFDKKVAMIGRAYKRVRVDIAKASTEDLMNEGCSVDDIRIVEDGATLARYDSRNAEKRYKTALKAVLTKSKNK